MICTGDIVAYGADPRPRIGLIRDTGIPMVMGNCEEQLAANEGDCGCGFTPGSACDRLSAAWFSHANREVSTEDRAWMEALPRQITLLLGRRRLAVLHGAPSRINRFLFASDPDEVFAQELGIAGVDGLIAGHSGLPFTRPLKDGRIWHNAGAIGMPANDGTPRGWYAIIEAQQDGDLSFTLHPLAYDHDAAAPKPDAQVALERLETLWFNTGTLCNLACKDCYIESSPRNDALSWLSLDSVRTLLDEAAHRHPELCEVAFTGGEPFMNPEIIEMLETGLNRGLRVLVLTNAMTPMRHHLPALRKFAGQDLHLRVSRDHYTQAGHARLRGPRA